MSDADRARWRDQARRWLRDDLAAWSQLLETADHESRDHARTQLRYWRVDRDLEGLRDLHWLEQLASAEREDCLALWKQVDAILKQTQDIR